MVALSNTDADIQPSREFDQTAALRQKLQNASGVNRAGRIFFGSVLVISALGLWAVPVDDGDAAMRLIKILVSVVLAGVGVLFFLSADAGEDLPEIQVDTAKRELRIIKQDENGASYVEAAHSFDLLSEITVRDRLLTARDETGHLVATVPLRDKATETALKDVLQRAA